MAQLHIKDVDLDLNLQLLPVKFVDLHPLLSCASQQLCYTH